MDLQSSLAVDSTEGYNVNYKSFITNSILRTNEQSKNNLDPMLHYRQDLIKISALAQPWLKFVRI